MPAENPKVILLHGCSGEEIQAILKALKNTLGNEKYQKFAFCTSTPTNMDWKLKDLIDDVWEEHEFMRENPPGTGEDR